MINQPDTSAPSGAGVTVISSHLGSALATNEKRHGRED